MRSLGVEGVLRGWGTTLAWSSALEAFDGHSFLVGSEQDVIHWRAAGMCDASGRVGSAWNRALSAATASERELSIVARDGRIVFLTRVVAGRRDVVCVLTRGAVRGADLRVTEPWVEVAVAPHTEAWTILRRVLPRDAALRRAPRTKVRHDPVVPRAVLTRPRPEHTSEYARWMADVFAQTPAFVEVCASPRRVVVVGEGREVSWIPGPRTLYRCEGDVVASVSDGDLATTLLSTLRLR